MAEIFASGKLWFRVPESIKVTAEGKLGDRVYAKDLTLKIIGEVTASGATYKAVEFYGDAIEDLSMAGRITLSNMAIEMGAKAGIVPPDATTFEYLKDRAISDYEPAYSDENADYVAEYHIDVNSLEPQVACPHEVDNVCGVSEIAGKKLDQAFIGTCTNGRLEDLEAAAKVLEGNEVAVRTIIIPASRQIMKEAAKKGLIEIFLDAGATMGTPGCGPCLGGHMGVIGEGEVCISTANRNFRGRMGTGGYIYLASPATVAASAIKGEITDPRNV
jgi:methanogen homoaconitase large subunit